MQGYSSIHQLLSYAAEHWAERPALVAVDVDTGEERHYTYGELAESAVRSANLLTEKGVRAGDRVAFLFSNTAEIIMLELGAGLLGASCVPLDSKRDTKERKLFKLRDTGAKLFFAQASGEATELEAECPGTEFVLFGEGDSFQDRLEEQDKEPSFEAADSLEPEYVVLYTSGTTANPKGVSLSARACFANAQGIIEWQRLSPEDRFNIILPLHHINSTVFSLATLLAGATIVLNSRYSASRFWEVASRHRATITSVVPTVLHDLLSRSVGSAASHTSGADVGSGTSNTPRSVRSQTSHDSFQSRVKSDFKHTLKRVLIGSAPVLPEETLKFMDTFGVRVCQGYGQTETALRVTGVPVDLPEKEHREITKLNSIGAELANSKLKVVKEDGTEGTEGEEGEIVISGSVLAEGYINNEEETGKVFQDGWYYSGDIGSFAWRGERRYFFIKGRKKEIIIKGGANISPAAVEDALLKAYPQIEEVCVVGYPEERVGEEIAAVVRFKDEAPPAERERVSREITEDSGFEAPRKVVTTAQELPKTSTGKIQRVKVKEMVQK